MNNQAIRLRKVEPQDLPLLYVWENDARAWTGGGTHNPLSQKDLQDYIDSSTGDIYRDGQLRLMIVVEQAAGDGMTVGCVDLFDFEPLHRRAALGLYIDEAYRRKGYAEAALKRVEAYAFEFLHLRLLYAEVARRNVASVKLFEKNDYQLVATLPKWLNEDDVMVFVRYESV